MNTFLQYVFYLALLCVLAIPLGKYIYNAMSGKKCFLSAVLRPCENGLYKLLRVDAQEDMSWKKYAGCALAFSGASLLVPVSYTHLYGAPPTASAARAS